MFADIDECARGLDNCDINADCTNSIGSFSCTCVHGYSGDGVTCSKLNHCRCYIVLMRDVNVLIMTVPH